MSTKPSVLYKYRQVDDNSIDALSKGKLWYSKPSGLNDPHDVAPRWKKELTDTEILEDFVLRRGDAAESEVKDFKESMAKLVAKYRGKGWNDKRVLRKIDEVLMPVDKKTQREILQDTLYYNEVLFASMGVLSLAEDPKNSVMWGSYCNSHRGFCLGFEYHETNVLGQYSNKVNYFENMPKPSAKLFSHDTDECAVEVIAYSKSVDWKYETEWRVLKQQGNALFSYPGKLVEVILGMNTSEVDIAKVRKAVKESGYAPTYYILQKNEDEYGYSLVRLDHES